MKQILTATLFSMSLSWSASDFLKTSGTAIKDDFGNGNIVRLYGTNIGGWQIHEPWMSPLDGTGNEWDTRKKLTERFGEATMWDLYRTYWSSWLVEDDFKKIADAGLNCIRLPIFYLNHMDDNGNWRLDKNGNIDFTLIDWAVNTALKYGIYTILDLHGAPGSQNNADHSGRQNGFLLYSEVRYQDMLVKFWQGVATHYKGHHGVAAYDLLNEPSENFPESMGTKVQPIFDRLYKAIRAIDVDHIIVLEAIWFWDRLPNPATLGWKNVMYSLHYYWWWDNGNLDVMKKAVNDWIATAQKYQAEYKVPHYIGEFTLFDLKDAWDYGLTRFSETDASWTTWTYKIKGNSNWGMYKQPNGGDNTPNINNDNADVIKTKWGKWNTNPFFSANNDVINAMKKATAIKGPVKRPSLINTPVLSKFLKAATASENVLEFDLELNSNWTLQLVNVQGSIEQEIHGFGKPIRMQTVSLKPGIYFIKSKELNKIVARFLKSKN